ncbi:MAG: T9SS type A sorting domain-containing protein [Muribaculaceae bacterium]|nr:T9SS type A sorting domain-containing protein [Muribaculaceae bacterium]
MDEPVEIGAVVSNGDWNEMTFALPAELLDKEWVNLFLEASFPEGSSQWVCMDSYSITPASGVSSAVGGAVSVSGADGRVIIVSAEASPYAVYAVDGRMLASGEVLDRTVLELPAGVYIVTVGSDSFRVAVR